MTPYAQKSPALLNKIHKMSIGKMMQLTENCLVSYKESKPKIYISLSVTLQLLWATEMKNELASSCVLHYIQKLFKFCKVYENSELDEGLIFSSTPNNFDK